MEAVEKILDSLDDIHALQDQFIDPDVMNDMLRDVKLHELLQVCISIITTLLFNLNQFILHYL